MTLYYFNVNDGRRVLVDPDGTELPDDEAAREHATQVARELMRNARPHVRNWRVQVRNSDWEVRADLLFASVDDRLDILSRELRQSVERMCGGVASLGDSIRTVRMSLHRMRATLAHAEHAPYVAAIDGERVDPAA
jgi:hypothetical protein